MQREPPPRRAPAIRSGAFVAAFAPHVVLGSYLAFVPDRTLFTATQVATLAHVTLALVTLPMLSYWVIQHVRARLGVRSAGVADRPAVTRAVRLALTVAAAAAIGTGLDLLGSGDGMPSANWHRWAGLLAIIVNGTVDHWDEAGYRAALRAAFTRLSAASPPRSWA